MEWKIHYTIAEGKIRRLLGEMNQWHARHVKCGANCVAL